MLIYLPPKDRAGSVNLCAYYLCRVHAGPHCDAHRSSSASARRGSNSHAVRICCCHCAADAPAALLLAEPGALSSGAAHTWHARVQIGCSQLGRMQSAGFKTTLPGMAPLMLTTQVHVALKRFIV